MSLGDTNPIKVTSFLVQWVMEYVKHKDIYTKSIQKIDVQGSVVQVTYAHKIHGYCALPDWDASSLTEFLKAHADDYTSLVTLNTRSNLDELIQQWKDIVPFERFNVFFVNPFSTSDKRWIISPFVHNKICDESALKQGLGSMFMGVDDVTQATRMKMEKPME